MPEDNSRYSRQVLFPGIGISGQEKISNSRVVIVGCGALGTVQADALCRAGVGYLKLIDRDFVEESNLQRQTLFSEEDVRQALPKSIAAQRRLSLVNSQVQIDAVVTDLHRGNIEHLMSGMHCIVDATDNFETRFLINDVAIKHKIPWIYGAAVGGQGLCMTILPGDTPCLRCVMESLPAAGTAPTCDTAGILGPVANIVASVQATETLKILTGNLHLINRKLLHFDVWENTWRSMEIASARRQEDCPCCQRGLFETLAERGQETTANILCGRDSVQVRLPQGRRCNLEHLAQRLERVGRVRVNEYLLCFQCDPYEIAVFPDGRGIVRGTRDAQLARSLYSKYVGT